MSIDVNEKNLTFWLENSQITYAFGIGPSGLPEHLHFGEKIGKDLVCGKYPAGGEAQVVWNTNSRGETFPPNVIPFELHLPMAGDYTEPTLLIRQDNGSRRNNLMYKGYEILKEKPNPEGLPYLMDGETLRIDLESDSLRVSMFYTVYEDCNAIVRRLRIENISSMPVTIDRAFSFSLDLPKGNYDAVTLHGMSAQETQIQRQGLSYGTFSIDSKRGYSGSVLNPFMAICTKNATENEGKVYGVNLVYSGSHTLKAETKAVGTVSVTGGINDFDFSWALKPGEGFETPEVVLAFSANGFNAMSQAFHNAYRNHLIPKRFVKKTRPIVINHWEATRFIYDSERIKSIIDNSVGLGIDTFVLDDGWFGIRDDQTSGLGDWFVNEKKLGGTLNDLISYVHEKGFRFGLWIEPEMINRNSNLYKAHPDWVLRTPDDEPVEARCQLVLDLSQDKVVDYISDIINNIIRTHEIDYVKWDCNRALTEFCSPTLSASQQQETSHRHILGLYRLFHNIIEENPDIIFEGCASGGNRFDPGILYYFPQVWTSDNTDIVSRIRIQYGNSLCYPISSASAHVTACPNRRSSHITPFESRAAIAHLGPTGYELDISKLSEDEKNSIPSQVKTYRNDEHFVLNGTLYRLLSPFEGNYFAENLVSEDKGKALLTMLRVLWNYNEVAPYVYPLGLDPQRTYVIEETGETRKGSSWMYAGILPCFDPKDNASIVYHFSAID